MTVPDVPLRSVLNMCHWHTASPNIHAGMAAWLVAGGNKNKKPWTGYPGKGGLADFPSAGSFYITGRERWLRE